MSEFVAVEGLTLEPQGIVSIGAGTLTITATPSTKMKAEGSGVYTTPLTFTLTGANATGYETGTVQTAGPGSITATAVKVRSQGSFVMRVEDQNLSIAMSGVVSGSGSPSPFTEPWKITDAGQAKVKAE